MYETKMEIHFMVYLPKLQCVSISKVKLEEVTKDGILMVPSHPALSLRLGPWPLFLELP